MIRCRWHYSELAQLRRLSMSNRKASVDSMFFEWAAVALRASIRKAAPAAQGSISITFAAGDARIDPWRNHDDDDADDAAALPAPDRDAGVSAEIEWETEHLEMCTAARISFTLMKSSAVPNKTLYTFVKSGKLKHFCRPCLLAKCDISFRGAPLCYQGTPFHESQMTWSYWLFTCESKTRVASLFFKEDFFIF